MCNLRHKLRNTKKGVGQTFTGSNEAWSTQISSLSFNNILLIHLIIDLNGPGIVENVQKVSKICII